MAEVETPVVTEERLPAILAPRGAMIERWLEQAPDKIVERIETLTKVLEQLRLAAIRQTYPSDWVIHTTLKDDVVIKQVGYLQDSGAERAGKVFGIDVGKPIIEREEFDDGNYAYHMEADAWSKVTGERIERVEGSRWSGDRFFQNQLKKDEDRIDPTDVRKAAYANLHGRAVRAIAGLSAVPLATLKAAGIDTDKCLFVGYDLTAGTSGSGVGGVDVVVAFGKSRGKKPAELEDGDLAWYIKTYGENVADPAKSKYVKANQRVLDALRSEKERRDQVRAQETAGGAPGSEGGDKPTTIAELRGMAWTLLQDAAGREAIPLLRLFTAERVKEKGNGAERGAPSECTEEELRDIVAYGLEPLKVLAGQLKGQAKK